MATTTQRPKLVVIVGPTASGKSALAHRLAKHYDGEIIAADSRTIYRGMDIGTAKPSREEQGEIPHWGLDLVNPDQPYSAKQFKDYAKVRISDIQKRGHLPILVGGTGLYINSVIFDYQFDADAKRDPINPRHRLKKGQEDNNLIIGCLIIGLRPEPTVLEKRIKKRAETMVEDGLVTEVKKLAKKYPAELEAFKAPGYQPFVCYVHGELSLQEAKKLLIQAHLKIAKKQCVWFKRNKNIVWFSDIDSAEQATTELLNT